MRTKEYWKNRAKAAGVRAIKTMAQTAVATIDWAKAGAQIDGAILKIGCRGYETGKIVMADNFKANADACKKRGIPFGVYFLSQAASKYKTTYGALAKYNNISNPNMIYAGQQIKIPQ